MANTLSQDKRDQNALDPVSASLPSMAAHILGPGALGCLWAAYLSPRVDVTLIAREAKAKQFNFDFVPQASMDSAHSRVYSLPLHNGDINNIPTVHTLLVFTKSNDTLDALEHLRAHFGDNTVLVLFQNGLGSQFQVMEAFADYPLLAAVTTEGAHKSGQNVVHAGLGKTTLGALNTAGKSHIMAVHALLHQSGLAVEMAEDIWPHLWYKLAINCAINPFTALADCANGDIQQSPAYIRHWPALREELLCLLHHAGYPLDRETLEQRVNEVRAKTASNISSMLQDVRRGRTTEIDHINGFAARYLRQRNAAHGSNQWLWEQVCALGH